MRIGRVDEGNKLIEERIDCTHSVGMTAEDMTFSDRRQLETSRRPNSTLAMHDTAEAIKAVLGWTKPMDIVMTPVD